MIDSTIFITMMIIALPFAVGLIYNIPIGIKISGWSELIMEEG